MDKKAVKIFRKMYRSSSGKMDSYATIVDYIEEGYITREEFEYAKSKGVMFEDKDITHDECVQRVCNAVAKINEDDLAKAFLSSLSTRTLYMRSAIACYRNVKDLSPHSYAKCKNDVRHGYTYNHFECEICKGPMSFFDARSQEILLSSCEYRIKPSQGFYSANLNDLNWERITWGGIRLYRLIYCMLDLEAFLKLEITDATDKDIYFFNQLLRLLKVVKQMMHQTNWKRELRY